MKNKIEQGGNEATTIPVVKTPLAPQEEVVARPKRLNFSDPGQRGAHLSVFLAWLPPLLLDAPGIDWQCLPSPVMGYLVRIVADSPDAISIAFAVGCAVNGLKQSTLLSYCRQLTVLLRQLRTHFGMRELADLQTRTIWDRFVKDRILSSSKIRLLVSYESFASLHIRTRLEECDVRQHLTWERYALPSLPTGFIEKRAHRKAAHIVSQKRRKEQSDVLVPIFPLLIEIAQLRKQAAERLVKTFRVHRDRAIAGEITLPYHFEYTDRQFIVAESTLTLAETELVERQVVLSLTLWDRVSWFDEHSERFYGNEARQDRKHRRDAYALERNTYFLQYEGMPEHLLWCGDLIANRQLGNLSPSADRKRSHPFHVSRPGVLTPSGKVGMWFLSSGIILRSETFIEPESLYKGVLFATALATLTLTNGSRVSELLQVSTDRFETLVVDELRNQQPTGRKIGILVQNLLPKGSTQESERQFFLISEMAGRLLTEIGQLLEATHGGTIPVVHPSRHSKAEDLYPEPYLFQWSASEDGRMGMLTTSDVGPLLRFLFHGLTLTTRTGEPILVGTHLLRHVLATHARQVKNVPAEAVAFLLHHRVVFNSTHALSISEATAYYSRMPVAQLLALLFEAQPQLSTLREPSYIQVPSPRTMEQMDVALREIFEQWSMIGPTVLGYCSAGLCVRPNNRALCLGCPHLVPHYSNLPRAKTWRRLYVLQAELHDSHGHHVDAKQSRQMIQYLDDVITLMHIQIRTRQDGGYLPFADTLPPGQDDEGGEER